MTTAVLELLPEILELVVFALSSVGLSIAGVYIERFALATIQSGELTLGLWAGVIGAVVLSASYLIATDKFTTKLAEVKNSLNTSPESLR